MTILAMIMASGLTSPAGAMTAQQMQLIEFYDDDSYSNMVGQIILFCDGTRFRSGAYTMYTLEYYYDCD
jgi:hypothetical protein